VAVQVTAQGRDDVGQRAVGRGRDLAAVLPQRRRDPHQPECRIDLGLVGAGEQPPAVAGDQPVLAERRPLPQRPLADADVVGLRPREVDQRGTPYRGVDGTDIDLQIAYGDHGQLRVTVGDDVTDELLNGYRGQDLDGPLRGDQQVEIANGVPAPPHAAGQCGVDDIRQCHGPCHQLLGDADDVRQRCALGQRRVEALQTCPQVLLGLRSEPLQSPHLPGRQRVAQAAEGVHAKLLVQNAGGLRTQARHLHQRDEAGWDLTAQLDEHPDLAVPLELHDLARGRGPDALDARQVGRGQLAQVDAGGRHRVPGALVRPHAEPVGTGQLEQVGDLIELAAQLLVRPRHRVAPIVVVTRR
jgi:hypothetical protein